MLVLLYFLLAWGDFLLRKFVSALKTWPDKRKAVAFAHTIQTAMARYLFTITMAHLLPLFGPNCDWPQG